ncbi:MAG: GNAT family N-acetyltransferase [Chloroflexota bacterium]
MQYLEVSPEVVPLALFLEADPSESSINSYLAGSWCFAAQQGKQIIGACVAKTIGEGCAEIFNISVLPSTQGKGIGTKLLKFVLDELKQKGVQRVELGTGAFGYQLTYYHRLGFRVGEVIQNHFLDNYAEPIFENGIQHKDMLRLYLDLK